VITQWYDIVAVIGAIFTGFSAMLGLVVYLEQWLVRPDPSMLASAEVREHYSPDRSGIEHWAPDLSVPAGASHLPRAVALGLALDSPATRVSGHVFTVLPHNTG
jgi:hypothetical protein